MHKTILILLAVACLAAPVRADLWTDLAAYKMGDASNAPQKLEELVVQTPAKEMAPIEKKLIALLESKQTTPDAKGWICRMLQRIGTPASVPALAGVLHDKTLSHYARLALERMTDCPAACEAMRAALDGAPAEVKPGILGSLGERGDTRAVAKIAPLVGDANAAVAAAAMGALGKIGGKPALAALQQATVPAALQGVRGKALIACAAKLGAAGDADAAGAALGKVYADGPTDVHRVAALREMLKVNAAPAPALVVALIRGRPGHLQSGALRLVVTEKSPALTSALVASLGDLSPAARAHVIELLGKRGDKTALSVTEHLESADPAVRAAAISAVADLGGPPQVRILLEQTKAAAGDKAVKALARMSADGVDAALIELLKNDVLRAEAAKVLGLRGCRAAAKQFVAMTADPNGDVRLAAWKSVAELATGEDIPALLKALTGKEGGEHAAAQAAIKRICSEASDRDKCFEAVVAHSKTDPSMQKLVLELGPAIGTRKALAVEQAALKSPDAETRRTALRALAAWPNADAAPDLIRLAGEGDDEAGKILALRGLIELARRGRNDRDKVKQYKAAMELVKRPEEKLLLISALRDCRTIESFRLLTGYFADAKVNKEAKLAACDLVRRMRNNKKFRKELVPALTPLTDAKEDKKVARAAQDCLKNLK